MDRRVLKEVVRSSHVILCRLIVYDEIKPVFGCGHHAQVSCSADLSKEHADFSGVPKF
jgi:hypothetical protein